MQLAEWTTDSVDIVDRFSFWRDAVCDAFLRLRPECPHPSTFTGRILVQRRDLIEIARIESSAQTVRRRPQDVATDGGWCYVNYQVNGVGRTEQRNREIITSPGDAVLVRTDVPFRFTFDTAFCQYSMRMPDQWQVPIDRPYKITAASVEGQALRALIRLTKPHKGGELVPWLDATIVGLIDAVLHRSDAVSNSTSPMREMWPRISADIDVHIRSMELSPAATARRTGLSVRRLHQLFEQHPRTYAKEVRHRRLELARRQLLDPAFDGLRIADVAADCGFRSVAHFQRVYRETYGQSPGVTRGTRATRGEVT